MELVYRDPAVLVCVKPAGVLSTDEPGGVPDLVREALGDAKADVRTVHRLDRAVSGLMVLACGASAASLLSREIREGGFEKAYLAVVHGLTPERGELRDLLWRDRARKMTFVADGPGKGVQEALLDYETVGRGEGMSLVRIRLHTGRTHQIRVQFASRGWPLYGERKYCGEPDDCPLALWSCAVGFTHPVTGERLRFYKAPPAVFPWSVTFVS
jgi:23S rRNA pseudouridine1911/1915/1917 synthase